MSIQAKPEEVFVPLAQAELDLTHASDQADSILDQSKTPRQSPASRLSRSVKADHMRQALEVLPMISDQLAAGVKMAEENDQLRAELAGLRLLVKSPAGEATRRLQEEVERLTIRANNLRQAVKAAEKGRARTGIKQKFPSPTAPSEALQASINPETIASLAVALTEGGVPKEIAGFLLDEVDRVTGQQPLLGNAWDRRDQAIHLERLRGGMGQKLHELEGIVEITMARLTSLEEQLAGLESS